jgi:uncharacterized protein YpiB (UPF0302 family)
MVIRTKTVPGRAFIYRKESVETHLPEKAFHDVRLDQDEPIYVQLDFPGSAHSVPFLSILEDNPYEGLQINERYGAQASHFLSQMEESFLKAKLYREIDQALEIGDQKLFHQLSSQLRDVLMKDEGKKNL